MSFSYIIYLIYYYLNIHIQIKYLYIYIISFIEYTSNGNYNIYISLPEKSIYNSKNIEIHIHQFPNLQIQYVYSSIIINIIVLV